MRGGTLLRAVPMVLVIPLLTACLSSMACASSRVGKSNSLSECIAKAHIIFLGLVEAKQDDGDSGVVRVRVLTAPLKGRLALKEIVIKDGSFRSDYKGAKGGPLVVKQKGSYIFFLADSENHEYRLFDSHDGVVQSSGPVLTEITKQVQK